MIESQQNEKDKFTLELWYITKIQSHLYNENLISCEFLLDTSLLKVEFLEKLRFVIDEEHSIRLEGKLSYDVDKRSSEYNKLNSAIINGSTNEFLDYLKSIGAENTIYIFNELCLEIINYLRIKEKLSLNVGASDFIPINCTWEIDNGKGCFVGINDVWTVTEVCDIIPYYIDINVDTFSDLYNRKQEEKLQPVYHELLFESENAIRNYSIRSGLLILYSAFEVATKTYVREGKIQTDYVISKLQSAHLTELYKNYINKEISEILFDDEFKVLQEMTEFRNAVAHRGELTIKSSDKKIITLTLTRLFEYLSFVKIVIGRIDKELKYIV